MSQFSDYMEPRILDNWFNKVATTPSCNYLALYTVTPSDAGGGTEVTGGAYARQQVFRNASTSTPKWNLAALDAPGYVVDNANTITFPTATANWGNVVAFGIWDHATTGNLLMWGPLAATKTVNTNDTFKFGAGDLNLRAE